MKIMEMKKLDRNKSAFHQIKINDSDGNVVLSSILLDYHILTNLAHKIGQPVGALSQPEGQFFVGL